MSASSEKRFGRRGALLGLGAATATAAAGLPSLGGHAQAAPPIDEERPDAHEPDAHEPQERPDAAEAHGLAPADGAVQRLFAGLEGAPLESHWRVEHVYGIRAGAIPVVLSSVSGARFAVEVFRLAPEGAAPIGVAAPLALHLSNRGDGRAATDEVAGLGVQALARALERRLSHGAPVPEGLLTHAQRRAQHPAGIFHVPV